MSTLQGKTIVITRPQAQAQEMIQLLTSKGAIPYLFPVIKTVELGKVSNFDLSLQKLDRYDWILFTSVNAAKFFCQYIEKRENKDELFKQLKRKKVAAIGPKTARVLREKGIIAALPESFIQEGLVDLLKHRTVPGMRILIPKAEVTRTLLREVLQACGLIVEEFVIYKTVAVTEGKESLWKNLEDGIIDVLTFTSSSTVRNFMAIFEDDQGKPFRKYLQNVVIACIGPVTTETVKEFDLPVHAEAEHYTIEGLIAALENYYRRKQVDK